MDLTGLAVMYPSPVMSPNFLQKRDTMDTDRRQPAIIYNLLHMSRDRPHLNHLGYPSNGFISQINRKITNIEDSIMASKNSSKASNRSFTEISFVNIKITGKHKDAFSTWKEAKPQDVALDVASFMSNGHKTSITWDTSNNCWIVSATCKEDTSPNVNCCLSSRSDDWYEAMCMNVYKHKFIAKEGSWKDQEDDSNWG